MTFSIIVSIILALCPIIAYIGMKGIDRTSCYENRWGIMLWYSAFAEVLTVFAIFGYYCLIMFGIV